MAHRAEFRLLGPLEVRRDGTEVPVPPGKQRVLLAALLLRAGQPVGPDELAGVLWESGPPVSVRASLQTQVARLRRTLAGVGQVIVTHPAGYLIEAGLADIDVARFESALTAGMAAAREQSWAESAAVLAGALALWRGQPLSGIASDLLTARELPRLQELRLQALEARIEADLHLGRCREVIGELRQLTAAEPLRERLHGQLMLALHQDGQQGAALAAYHQARRTLADELGVGPGAELRRRQAQILGGRPPPGPAAAASHGDPALPPSRPDARFTLPPGTAAFTGRGGELASITAAVTAAAEAGVVAICAISGMPGAGKTALAVHAAHALRDKYPDRQLFIDLNGHTPGQDPVTPGAALHGLLTASGVDPRSLPADVAGRAGMWRSRMARQRALLVLDNAASSAQVAPLLPGGPGSLVLVTSRRHLADLPGAVTPLLMATLPPEQAGQMYARLAPRAAAGPAAAVGELVALAGQLPLAISLLARVYNRHPSWTMADLVTETRARLLTMSGEQDSVTLALDVSWRYLDPGLQAFFGCLVQHPGTTVDAWAAAALGGVSLTDAAAGLDALQGEGLLTETGYRRYGMHDLIRRYVAGRPAAPPGAAGLAAGRLLDYYQHAAARAEALLTREPWLARPPAPASAPPAPASPAPAAVPDWSDPGQALDWARSERANLLACVDHAAGRGQLARVVGLTAALTALLRHDGPWADAVTRHAAAAAAAGQISDSRGQAGALLSLGTARRLAGDMTGSARALDEAAARYGILGDRAGVAAARQGLAAIGRRTGDYPAANQALAEALATYRQLGVRHGEAHVLSSLGEVRYLTGDYQGAARFLESALSLFQELGDHKGQAGALIWVGAMRRRTGDYPGAAGVLQEAQRIARGGDRLDQVAVLTNLAAVRRLMGDLPAADRNLQEALPLAADLGSQRFEAIILNEIGVVRRETGDFPAAARALQDSLAAIRALGDRGGEAETLNEIGTLNRLRGGLASARADHRQALNLSREIASPQDEASALAGLGRCAVAEDDIPGAVAYLRQALSIFEQIGAAEAAGLAAELAAIDEPGKHGTGRAARSPTAP